MTENETGTVRRCPWAAVDPLLATYHDTERGRFPSTEAGLFEALSLDVLQRGRSWRDVLLRRESLRRAFAEFDPARVAEIDEAGVARISHDLGLHGHDGRVRAVAQNARRLLAARAEWGSGRDDVAAFATWLLATPPAAIVAELAERFRCVTTGSARNFVEAIGRVPLGHAPECWRARGVILDLDGMLPDDSHGAAPLDGAGDAIRALVGRHPLAVTCNRPLRAIRTTLAANGVDGVFEVIISAEQLAVDGTPADAFLLAAGRLALRPADCFVLAASSDGLDAADAAGMVAVLVSGSSTGGIPSAVGFDRVPGLVHDVIAARKGDPNLPNA